MLSILFFPMVLVFGYQACQAEKKIDRFCDTLAALCVLLTLMVIGAFSLAILEAQAEKVITASVESREAYARYKANPDGRTDELVAAKEAAAQQNFRQIYKAIQAQYLEERRSDAATNLWVVLGLGVGSIADWPPGDAYPVLNVGDKRALSYRIETMSR